MLVLRWLFSTQANSNSFICIVIDYLETNQHEKSMYVNSRLFYSSFHIIFKSTTARANYEQLVLSCGVFSSWWVCINDDIFPHIEMYLVKVTDSHEYPWTPMISFLVYVYISFTTHIILARYFGRGKFRMILGNIMKVNRPRKGQSNILCMPLSFTFTKSSRSRGQSIFCLIWKGTKN
jgi:hypothetical protein